MQEIKYFGERVFKWQRGKSSFLAWPERGARLMNWNLAYADGSFRDIIHWPNNLSSLDQVGRVRGGNPILFPFCGRCYDSGEIGFWKTPTGERRAMPMHGFAREGAFEVQHLNQNGFSARLLPTDEDRKCYPYRYEFTVSYRFEELSLYVELGLRNLDTVPIPWSAGHHFYFTLPSRDGFSRADYGIFIPAKEAYKHAANGDLAPVLDFPQENRFDSLGLQDRIHTGLKLNTVSFGPVDGSEKITLRIGSDEKPARGTAVVTWTEANESPFYCVEPWMGPPNSPNHKLGLHLVPPGKAQYFLAEIHLA
jgi:galactose mutarotase-like enzyme